jgi:predicted NUDIX family NTP pyrophosphohydrolase
MIKRSAGLVAYKTNNGSVEVFLVHPGGPFFAKKDLGSWSIPKGEFEMEEPLAAARREFEEETGVKVSGEFIELKPIKQKGGKLVYAWAVEVDLDPKEIRSNTFSLEWPPKSGVVKEYPEVDCAEWFDIETAKKKILGSQAELIEELVTRLSR